MVENKLKNYYVKGVIVITEDESPLCHNLMVEVVGSGKKLYNKSQATSLSKKSCNEGDTPMICEYEEVSKSGRTVKRFLPLVLRCKP